MSRARARYTEADVARILKAAAKAHVDVRVKIMPDGTILIATGKTDASDIEQANEWDEVLPDGAAAVEVR